MLTERLAGQHTFSRHSITNCYHLQIRIIHPAIKVNKNNVFIHEIVKTFVADVILTYITNMGDKQNTVQT